MDQPPGSATRQRIVDAATALFVTRGYGGTSTRDIAAAVGIKQPSLYAHFAVKSDLLLEVLLQALRPSLEESARLQADPTLSAVERLSALVSFDVRLLCSGAANRGLLAYLPEVRATDVAAELASHQKVLHDAYRVLVADVLAERRLHGDADRLTTSVFALVEGTVLRRVVDPELDPDATAAEVAAGALRLIGG